MAPDGIARAKTRLEIDFVIFPQLAEVGSRCRLRHDVESKRVALIDNRQTDAVDRDTIAALRPQTGRFSYRKLQAAIRAKNSATLIIDFSHVPYIDSAGIGALVGAYVSQNKEGRKLALVGVSDRLITALKVTRVEQFFRFYKSLPEAEQA